MAGTEDDNYYESDPTLPGSAAGISFQLNLVMLLLIRGVRDGYEFQLGCEVKLAGKFDDITFKYNNKLILIQMKHRKDDATVINMNDLVKKNGQYSVATYFQSWREIKHAMKNITAVVLFTNVNFKPTDGKARRGDPPDPVLEVVCRPLKNPEYYQLTAAWGDQFCQSLQTATSSDNNLQDDIDEFLKTFHLAVCQPCDDELGRAVKEELKVMCPLDTDNIVYHSLKQKISKWFKRTVNNKKKYFTRESSAGMLKSLYNRVHLSKALKCNEMHLSQLRGYGLLFEGVSSKLSAFMRGDAKEPVFRLNAGHALVGAAAALQAWDWLVFVGEHPSGGCIRLQLSSLLLPGVGDMVERGLNAAERRGLLLLECDVAWGDQGEALAAKLAATLKEGARLVLVSGPGSAALPDALESEPAVREEDHRSFLHLLPEAQARILNMNVTLQGRTVQLGAVLGQKKELYGLIDADVLVSIISCGDNLVEIAGSANPTFGRYDLTSYVDRSLFQKDAEPISEQTVAMDDSQAIVIISDVAGSGKSMVLARLAKKISELHPADWLIKLDLNDYTSVLKEKSSTGKPVLIDDFLRWETPKLSGKLLHHFLHAKPRKVTVMLDGFDEISPNYKAATIQLMTDLVQNKTRLLVTTRPHLRSDLERALGASAYSLRPLTTDEQYAFLKEYWKQNLLGVQLPEARMNSFASALIVNISQSLSEHFTSFCESPLQLKMLAELYIDVPDGPYQGCKQFCETFDADPQLPAKINISELYEKFVNKKISICYYDKQNVQESNLIAQENVEGYRESFFMKHQLLALQSLSSDSLLSDDENEKLVGYMAQIKYNKERDGLLARVVDGRPVFVHRTFAEFFLAKHFTAIVSSQNLACRKLVLFILKNQFVEIDYEVSRHFIDSQLAEHVGKIGFLLDNMKEDDIDYFRIIQLSFKEGTTHISSSFLHYIHQLPMEIRGDFNETLKYDMTDVLEQAGRLERLLSREPNEDPAVLGAVMDLILAYMGEGSPDGTTLGSLLQSGVDINAADDHGNTVIHNFIEKNWEYRAPSAQSDDHPLHSLHSYSPFDTNTCTHEVYCRVRNIIILYLMFYGANVDLKNNLGQTPLMLAIKRNARDIVKLLVDAGCDLAARDAEGNSVLEWTVRFRKVYNIHYSTEPDPNHGELTHTHIASPSCYVLYYVFARVARIDKLDDRGSTVVHTCIEKGWPSFSDSVLIHSYLPSTHIPDDATVESVRRQVREMIMRIIFSRLSDINIRDGRGQTPLMLAIRANDIDMINLLLVLGSNINLSDGEGRSIPELAAEYCDADVAQLLRVYKRRCFSAIVNHGPEI